MKRIPALLPALLPGLLPGLLLGLLLGLLPCPSLHSQMLAVDRGVPQPAGNGSEAVRLGWTKSPGFVGDHFTLGKRGDVWIIDAIRTYSMPEGNAPIEDLYEKASLFGGIETQPPEPGQPPQPECDCHNLMVIQSMDLGRNAGGKADAAVSQIGPGVWQVDFRNLHWSVPGGAPIQFGVTATPRHASTSGPVAWFNRGGVTSEPHELRIFDDKGKQQDLAAAPLPHGRGSIDGPTRGSTGGSIGGSTTADPRVGINVQVWAHKMAPVSIRAAGAMIEVSVPTSGMFDPQRIDVSSLRFGPANTPAESSRIAVTEGNTELLVSFRRSATGLRGNQLNVCLNGREQGGAPFEGCDQLKLQP